jgi:CSLREA domain-containing protein
MKGWALVLGLLPLAASAATITVNSTADTTTSGNGNCTLREAIANVNAAADTTGGDCAAGTGAGDTIKFSFAMPAKIRLALGALLIQRDVRIANPAPGSLRIDGARRTRVFEIAAGTTTMFNVTIEHGSAVDGGGVMVDHGATLSLANSVLTHNRAMSDDLTDSHGGAIFSAGTLSLTDCTLSRNTAMANARDSFGGGIHNAGGTATLTNCTFNRNTVDGSYEESGGGGISNLDGVVSLVDCRLVGNKATRPLHNDNGEGFVFGGGIHIDGGVVTLSNCTLTRNVVRVGRGLSGGGGISNFDGALNLDGCRLASNKAVTSEDGDSVGGGIYSFSDNNDNPITMTNCTLSKNIAISNGEGSFGGGIDSQGPMTLTNCTFSRNVAMFHGALGEGSGGGIYGEGGLAILTNCTLAGNRATSSHLYGNTSLGGGIFSYGEMYLTNCTLSGNTAQWGLYGLAGGGGLAGDFALVTNTIVANSGAAHNCEDEAVTSGGHNLSSDGTCFTSGDTDLLNIMPRLAPLANYGGPMETMALCTAAWVPAGCRAASPAIDAGNDAVTGPPASLSTDQRGRSRRSGAHVDIGAYEVQ